MNDFHSTPPVLPDDQLHQTDPASPSGWRRLLTRRWLIVIAAVLALRPAGVVADAES